MNEVQNEGFFATLKEFLAELLGEGAEVHYENLSFGNPVVTYRVIILAFAVGLIVASVLMMYKRRVCGRFVRSLYSGGAVSPESAKTVSQLGYKLSWAVSYSLRRGTLSRMICSIEKDTYDAECLKENTETSNKKQKKKIFKPYAADPSRDSFYLPENEKKRESMLSLFSEEGSGFFGFLLTVVLAVAGAALLFWAVPWLLGIIDGML